MLRALQIAILGALFACGSAEATSPSADSPEPAPAPSASAISAPAEDDAGLAAAFQSLSPGTLPAPPPDASNRYADDPKAAAFGQRLFFDRDFSGPLLDSDNDGSSVTLGKMGQTGKVACADCHLPRAGFSDNRSVRGQVSLASSWGKRRAPSLLDVGHEKLLMWDGRHDALYNQVFGALENSAEMNTSRLFVAEQVFAKYRAEYEAVFGPMPPLGDSARFAPLTAQLAGCESLDAKAQCHGRPGASNEFDALLPADQEAVTRVVVNFGKAIGAYERLLSCGPGRFDEWVHGNESALSDEEKRGANLFVGKANCVSCHGGPFLTDRAFHNVGIAPTTVALSILDKDDRGAAAGLPLASSDPLRTTGPFSDGDDGRLSSTAATVSATTEGAFRTPSLRCVASRPSFMHTGQLRSLTDVVRFFTRGGDASGYPGHSEIRPIPLDPDEQRALVAFLSTLDGPGPSPSLLTPP